MSADDQEEDDSQDSNTSESQSGDEDYTISSDMGEMFNFSPDDIDARLADTWFAHRVKKGETLSGIARKYGVGVASLKSANRLRKNRILAGQSLVIPAVSRNRSRNSYPDLSELWDQDLAQQLARESFQYGSTTNTQGQCLKGVRIALTRSLQKSGLVDENERLFLGSSAHQFKTWAVSNVQELCRRYRLVPIVGNETRPVYPGLIYVYGKGRCGYSKRFGHIETVISANPATVCSDSCRPVSENSCQPDLILAPCRSCPDRHGNIASAAE